LHIAEEILTKIPNSQFSIGGPCHDHDLLSKLDSLQNVFPNRFSYLGIVPHSKVIETTQNAHIGFFLIKPDSSYWVPCSPNKVFEYLSCGVIPVVRAECDYLDDIRSCGLFFDRNTNQSEISYSLISLLKNHKEMKMKMESSLKVGSLFTYENISHRYKSLYESVMKK
jgi:glycosyltransferase involved in cell wall biosynthesis